MDGERGGPGRANRSSATNGTGLTGIATITITPTRPRRRDRRHPQRWALVHGLGLADGHAGIDAGAGVDASRAVVERASATLTNGVCGTFGTFAAVSSRRRRHQRRRRQLLPLPGQGDRQRRQRLHGVGRLGRRQGRQDAARRRRRCSSPASPTPRRTGTVVYFRPSGSGSSPSLRPPPTRSRGSPRSRSRTSRATTSVGSGPHRTYLFTDPDGGRGPVHRSRPERRRHGLLDRHVLARPRRDAAQAGRALQQRGLLERSVRQGRDDRLRRDAMPAVRASTPSGGRSTEPIPRSTTATSTRQPFSVESLTHLKAQGLRQGREPERAPGRDRQLRSPTGSCSRRRPVSWLRTSRTTFAGADDHEPARVS